jgi:hypothetical protein
VKEAAQKVAEAQSILNATQASPTTTQPTAGA